MFAGIVLSWWGSDLRRVDADGREVRRRLEAGEDPSPLITELLDGSGRPGRRTVRIVYQPDGREGLDSAGREVPRLAAAVAHCGRPAEGAWTLTALLEATSAPGRRGSVHLLATAERSLVASASPEGGCWIRAHEGPDWPEATFTSLRTALARFDEGDPPGGIVVIEDGPHAEDLRAAARGLGPAGSSMSDLLRHADRLVPGDGGDFLSARPWHRRRSVQVGLATAAGLVVLATGLGLRSASRRREQIRREIAVQRERQRQRDENAAADRARQQAAALSRAALARAECPAQHHEKLLRVVARQLPETAVLERLIIEGGQFTLSGTNAGGGVAAGAGWPHFLRTLGAAENPWQLEKAPEPAGADFSLSGRFRPAVAPPESGGDSARLAALCAMFPSAGAFFAQWREWSRTWQVTAGPTEEFTGFALRHFTLNALQPTLEIWPEVVATVGALARQPGVTIERLALVAGPGERFRQAEIAIAVRLRP